MMPLRVPGLGSHTPNTKANVCSARDPALGADEATGGMRVVRRMALCRPGGSGDGGRCGSRGCMAPVQLWAPIECIAGASMQDRKAIGDVARQIEPLVRRGRAGTTGANGKQEGAQGSSETSEAADAAAAAAAAAGVGAAAPGAGAGVGAGGPFSTTALQAGTRPPRPPAAQGQAPRGPRPFW